MATAQTVRYLIGGLANWALRAITIDLTHLCNFKCPGCIERLARMCSGQCSLCAVTALKISDIFAERGGEELGFYGGEPTMHHQFPKVLAHVADLGLKKITVVTNGSLLGTPRIRKALWKAAKKTKLRVRVSLNAGRERTHDKLHGVQGFFPRIIKGMKRLTAGASALELGVSFLLDEANASEVLMAYEVARKVGATAFFLRPQTGLHGIGVTPLSAAARANALRDLETIQSRQEPTPEIELFVTDWHVDYLKQGRLPDTQKPYPTCYFCGGLRLVVSPPEPGMVWACAYFRSDPRFLIADLRDTKFGGPQFEQRRVAAMQRVCPGTDCAGVICSLNEANEAIWRKLESESTHLSLGGCYR